MNEKQIQEVMALVDNYAQAAYGLCGASASPQKLSECRAAIESALREQVREVLDEREAFVQWLSSTYSMTYLASDAEHMWRHRHVAALAWQARATLSAAPTQPAQPPEDLTRKCLPNGLRYKLPPLELTGHQVVQFADMVRAADSLDATWRLKELEPLSAYDEGGPCPGGVAVTTEGQPGYALLPTQPAQAEKPNDVSKERPAVVDFMHWLNKRRDLPVAEVFHDLVECYRRAIEHGGSAEQPKAAQQERADGGTVFCWLVEEFGPNGNSTGRYMLDQGELTITPDVHAARRFKGMRTAMFRADDMREKHGGDWRHAQHGFAAAPQREPMTDEQERAIHEAHCNEASDEYFNARPQLDSAVNRRIFYAGHRKAWITKKEQQA